MKKTEVKENKPKKMEGQEMQIDHRKLPWRGIWKTIAEEESARRGKRVTPEAVRMGVQGKSEYYLQLYYREIRKRKAHFHCIGCEEA